VGPIDLICEVCGTANRPGTEFCTNCNAYLAWDRSSAGGEPPGSDAASSPVRAAPRPEPADRSAGSDQAQRSPSRQDAAAALGSPALPAPLASPGSSAGEAPTEPQPTLVEPAQLGEQCPTCGLVNQPGKRFCAHCGFGFASSIPALPSTQAVSAWNQTAAARDRAARREYRRSLPPFYRWRRLVIGLLALALVVAAAVVVPHPVAAARDGWYALRKDFVNVAASASVDPADATAPGSDPAALVDRSVQEWTMKWQPAAGSGVCGAAAGTGIITLTFAPRRIRQLQIVPGLGPGRDRSSQPVPREIGIGFDDEECQLRVLANSDKQPAIKLDSGEAVSRVRIGIVSVYPVSGGEPLVSLQEIIVQSYPR